MLLLEKCVPLQKCSQRVSAARQFYRLMNFKPFFVVVMLYSAVIYIHTLHFKYFLKMIASLLLFLTMPNLKPKMLS